ncbi:MAG: hypothetical protein JNJ94_02165 [Chlorobi bacterium]|nr:hypothetical protein [Chlorobiota bacterium]
MLKIWSSYQSDTGRVVGFTKEDSLFSVTLSLQWDRSKFDINPNPPISGHIAGRAFRRTVTKDSKQGNLYIEFNGIDDNLQLRPFFGTDIPLLTFEATVTSPDVFSGLHGWAEVLGNLTVEAAKPFELVARRVGFVHVERIPLPQYTAKATLLSANFDTLRQTTVALKIENVKDQGVKEIAFTLRSDTAWYRFIDTATQGTIYAEPGWKVRQLQIAPDSLSGLLQRDSAVTTDGTLLNVVLQRRSDSSFSKAIILEKFSVDTASCISRADRENGVVRAERIVKPDTTDTTTTVGVDEQWKESTPTVQILQHVDNDKVVVRTEGIAANRVIVVDILGRQIPTKILASPDAWTRVVRFEEGLQNGCYIISVFDDSKKSANNQFTVIK